MNSRITLIFILALLLNRQTNGQSDTLLWAAPSELSVTEDGWKILISDSVASKLSLNPVEGKSNEDSIAVYLTDTIPDLYHDHSFLPLDGDVNYNLHVAIFVNGKKYRSENPSRIGIRTNVFIPNAFTPNEDGLNDYYHIVTRAAGRITQFDIEIYNRWGQKIYNSKDVYFKWDGTCEGLSLSSGVYTYVMKYRLYYDFDNEIVMTGHISLIR